MTNLNDVYSNFAATVLLQKKLFASALYEGSFTENFKKSRKHVAESYFGILVKLPSKGLFFVENFQDIF